MKLYVSSANLPNACAFDAENWESCVAVVILKVHLISIERLSLGSNRIIFFSF